MKADIFLRETTEDDLEVFFGHQREPEANAMAAFPARNREDFMKHWRENILGQDGVWVRTIVFRHRVVGNICSWEHEGEREVGYWIGRECWGLGVATRALKIFLEILKSRPLSAYVARHNTASLRVLEKCGFRLVGESDSLGAQVGEYLLRLDAEPDGS